MRDLTVPVLNKGIYNMVRPEVIPREAVADALNWRVVDEHLETARGRQIVGEEAAGSGAVRGHYRQYAPNGGALVELKKSGTTVKWHNPGTDAWDTIISGLTEDTDMTFSPYVSLAGFFVYAASPDGLWKIPMSSPASAVNVYDAAKNYKGHMLIDKSRAILWGRKEDPTGLYLSWIDAGGYTTVSAETFATGDGSTLAWSHTLSTVTGTRTAFGLLVAASTAAAKNISAITKASNALVTATSHGLAVGDKVKFASVVGMTEINGLTGTVMTVPTANTFTVDINSTAFTAYSSGGTATRREIFTDNRAGVLTSNKGGTGTINYATGAASLTFIQTPVNAVAITVDYQYEDSNVHGVTDFTYTTPARVAGEGDVIRQDIGGDKIVLVLPLDGTYFSIKERSVYALTLAADDLDATNRVFRTGIGMKSLRGAIATGLGIFFVNTADPAEPQLNLLKSNPLGDNFDCNPIVPQFRFGDYTYDEAAFAAKNAKLYLSCASLGADANDTLLEYDTALKAMSRMGYGCRTLTGLDGILYGGDAVSNNVWELLTGFDDDGLELENYFESREETYDTDELKKLRTLRIFGDITRDAKLEVYAAYDDLPYALVGTVLGDGTYVDLGGAYTVGENEVESAAVGGEGSGGLPAAPYKAEIRVRSGKFRLRKWKVALRGIGWASVERMQDHDFILCGNRLPRQYRTKQHVSLDGETTDMDSPA